MSAIQIRNVPEQLHHQLKARAEEEGLSLSDYLLAELRSFADRPSMRTWLDEASKHERVELTMSPAQAIMAERAGER